MNNISADLEPRKRPKQARSIATIEAIVEAAAHILQTGGLQAFNTNDVASRAGVSIGSLYQYFPSKEAILTEIVRRKRSDLYQGLLEAVSQSGKEPFEKTVRNMMEVKVRLQLRGHKMSRALDYVNSLLPLDAETENLNSGIIKLVAELLETHEHRNAFDKARDIVAITRGMVEFAALSGETDGDALTERCCNAIHGYLSHTQ